MWALHNLAEIGGTSNSESFALKSFISSNQYLELHPEATSNQCNSWSIVSCGYTLRCPLQCTVHYNCPYMMTKVTANMRRGVHVQYKVFRVSTDLF